MKGTKALDAWIKEIAKAHPILSQSQWLHADEMEVYVRRGYYMGRWWLAIANITVYNKGKGMFTEFLRHCLEVCPWSGVYAENVQNVRLALFLERQGFTWVPECVGAPSFYKETK